MFISHILYVVDKITLLLMMRQYSRNKLLYTDIISVLEECTYIQKYVAAIKASVTLRYRTAAVLNFI